MKRRSLRKRAFPKKRKIVRKALRKARDFNIRRIAQQVVSRNAEDKCARYANQGFLFDHVIGGSNFEVGNIWNLNAEIGNKAQGTGQGQRVGNRIKMKRLIYKQRFWCIDSVNDANNYHLKMFVLGLKQNPNTFGNGDVASRVQNGPFFNNGSSSTGATGTMPDMILPIDMDTWRVHKTREFKLGFSSNPQGTTSGWGNNDYKYSCSVRINLARYLPKFVHYQDQASGIRSRNICVLFLLVKANNTNHSPESNSGGIVGWARTIDFVYEDM